MAFCCYQLKSHLLRPLWSGPRVWEVLCPSHLLSTHLKVNHLAAHPFSNIWHLWGYHHSWNVSHPAPHPQLCSRPNNAFQDHLRRTDQFIFLFNLHLYAVIFFIISIHSLIISGALNAPNSVLNTA